jgi:hypothetical protein
MLYAFYSDVQKNRRGVSRKNQQIKAKKDKSFPDDEVRDISAPAYQRSITTLKNEASIAAPDLKNNLRVHWNRQS